MSAGRRGYEVCRCGGGIVPGLPHTLFQRRAGRLAQRDGPVKIYGDVAFPRIGRDLRRRRWWKVRLRFIQIQNGIVHLKQTGIIENAWILITMLKPTTRANLESVTGQVQNSITVNKYIRCTWKKGLIINYILSKPFWNGEQLNEQRCNNEQLKMMFKHFSK